MFGNFNKIMLLGRLTDNPEVRTFTNGGKVAKFTIAVNDRKKNSDTGDWEDNPTFVDCKIFNRGEFGKMADHASTYLHKGSLTFVEGKLVQERWENEAGDKRSKHIIYLDSFQVLDPKEERQSRSGSQYSGSGESYSPPPEDNQQTHLGDASGPPDEDIPF